MKTVYLVKAGYMTRYGDCPESDDIMIFTREEDAKRFIETKQEYFKEVYEKYHDNYFYDLQYVEIPLFSENDNINDLKDSDYLPEYILK